MQPITIAKRFCGPPTSGNGGYSCGLLGSRIQGPSRARLVTPPPLDTPLTLSEINGQWSLMHGEKLIGSAEPAALDLVPPAPPTLAQARDARTRYRGLGEHSFPTCFVCGPARAEGDGLRLFSGKVEGVDMVACDWQPIPEFLDPHGNTRHEFVWSALDCPSYFALDIPVESGKICLLAQMTCSVDKHVPGDKPLIVYAWKRLIDGRKHFSAAALCNAEGEILARAEHLWIALKN